MQPRSATDRVNHTRTSGSPGKPARAGNQGARFPWGPVGAWIETQYCASVAATLMARAEYFELLEDAMVSPARLVTALSAWRKHASQTHVLGELVGHA